MPEPLKTPRHILAALALVTLVCVLYGRVAWGMITVGTDTKAYVTLSEQWAQSNQIPHFLFPVLLVAVYRSGLVPSREIAGLAVLLACYSLTALLLYGIFRRATAAHAWLAHPAVIAALAFATMLAQPLAFANTYELGYFWPTQHDNPTSALAKPFSIIVFLCAAWCLSRFERPSWGVCAIAAGATVASALSKPSYLICLLPAAVMIAVVRSLRRKPLSIGGLLVCLLLPGACVIAWQYSLTFAANASSTAYRDRIVWAPLEVMRHYSSRLPLKFLLSIAFPLAVTAAFWQRARRDVALLLAWTGFLLGAFYAYTLAESAHMWAANFLWSPYAASFILLMASAIFWVRELTAAPLHRPYRHRLCAALFFLHAANGLLVIGRYWVAWSA